MTIGQKLYSGFGSTLFIMLVMGSVSIHNLNSLADEMTTIGSGKARLLYLAGDINKLSADLFSLNRGMNLRSHMNEMDKVRAFHETLRSEADHLKKDGEEFTANTESAEVKGKVQTELLDKVSTYLQLESEDYDLLLGGNTNDADVLYKQKLSPLAQAISDTGNEIAENEYHLVKQYASEAIGSVPAVRGLSIAMMVLAILVGAAVIWVTRGINRVLQDSIVELNDGAEQVATAADQVSSSSQSLAQGASEQAASLEETSASSEEINSMARKNTDNSRSTADLLARSQEKVNQANRYLEDMVLSMDLITDSSGKISKIIKVIDEIAFQTNILALNAAVEAARAGEAGMGFAVVADEVRSLAQRSAQAAKDTAILIEDSITRSNEGKIKVDQVAVAIRAVTEDSAKVKVMVDEVSLGSEEQSRGIEQIGRAISQMEQVTQTNAASAEEGAAAAEELSAQSETLKDVIGRLHEMVGGGSQTMSLSPRSSKRSPVRRPQTTVLEKTFSSKPVRPMNLNRTTQAHLKPSAAEHTSFPLEENFQPF